MYERISVFVADETELEYQAMSPPAIESRKCISYDFLYSVRDKVNCQTKLIKLK